MLCREQAVDFLHFLGTVFTDTLLTPGEAGEKAMGAGEDLLVLFPWLGDALDKKHELEAPQRSRW